MDRLKVGIIFGGCSEEHPVSVKSAQEVAKNLDPEKYEPFWIGITKSGAWKLCDGPGANWESGSSRPAVLSPDRSVHGLLVLEQEQYEAIRLDVVLPVLHGKLGEDGAMQGPAGALRHPLRGLRRPEFCPVHGQIPGLHRRQERGNRHAELPGRDGEREDRSRQPHLSRLREAGPFGFIVRRQQGIGREELPSAMEIARQYDSKVLIEEAVVGSEVGCADPGERFGSDRRRGRPSLPVSRLLQNPSGE